MAATNSGNIALSDERIALIGYGEVGAILGRALRERTGEEGARTLRTFDRLAGGAPRKCAKPP